MGTALLELRCGNCVVGTALWELRCWNYVVKIVEDIRVFIFTENGTSKTSGNYWNKNTNISPIFEQLNILNTSMMKNLTRLILFSLPILFSSCLSTFRGEIQQSGFSINDCDFQIIKTVEGSAKATYILGIGGNLRDGLINDAKRNMYSTFKLGPNQQITNITTDIKGTSFIIPIFSTQTAIITADIIEFFPRDKGGNTIVNQNELMSQNPVDQINMNKTLTEIKSSKEIKVSKYISITDAKQGDFVKVTFDLSGYTQTLFGKVERTSGKSYLLVEFEPTPGTFTIEEHPLKNCEKVIAW